jgi:hypothetical protein
VVLVVAVAGALALEVVPFHGTGEAASLARRRDVDLVAGVINVNAELLADLVGRSVLDPQLDRRAP